MIKFIIHKEYVVIQKTTLQLFLCSYEPIILFDKDNS